MKANINNTKIVVTTGPACMRKETLAGIMEAGRNVVFRLNFSHGNYDEKNITIRNIRSLERKLKRPIAIFGDLQGPKIRLGKIRGGYAKLTLGQEFILTGEQMEGDEKKASISNPEILMELEVGKDIYINDGLVKLKIKKKQANAVITEVVDDGEISDGRGINFPGSEITISAITQKDKDDLAYALDAGVDFIALSYVRTPKEIYELRQIMEQKGRVVPIISKIEKWEAIANIDKIIEATDMIMIARGDLGVELPYDQVPLVQKKISALCQEKGKPVITATQMLISMVNNPTPTRAEVTDVANAILDGTDAVMLSNETAMGKYPVKAVETMAKVIESTENSMMFKEKFAHERIPAGEGITASIAHSASKMAKDLGASVIACATETGNTARLISRYRQKMPILALSPKEETLKRLQLSWGVIACKSKPFVSSKQVFDLCQNIGEKLGLLSKGDILVMTCGTNAGQSGSTNLVKVEKV